MTKRLMDVCLHRGPARLARLGQYMARQVIQNFRLHSFDFRTVAASHSREFIWSRCNTQLGQQPLEVRNSFLTRLQFLVAVNHPLTSTMPRFVRSRLICQCLIKSSSVSESSIAGRI